MKEVTIPTKEGNLAGMLFVPEGIERCPALLCLHGWTSKQDRYFDLANDSVSSGYACLTVDMRGHGRTGGELEKLSRQDFLDDVTAAYDFLTSVSAVDPSRIVVSGSSFGGYMAALLCAERSCAGLILRAPADYPDAGWEESHYNQSNDLYINEGTDKVTWRSTVHPPTETRALRAVHAFTGPVLIIESGSDEVVPQAILQGYADAVSDKSKLTYSVMEGAPHSLSPHPERQRELIGITLSWIGRTFPK